MKKQKFGGKILIVGFGSIGQGFLPLLLRHFTIDKKDVTIVTADKRGQEIAKKYGIRFIVKPVTKTNYKKILDTYLNKGDFLLNLSVDVSSVDLIKLCHKKGVLYLDTVVEPWAGYYTDPRLSMSKRSNYALREQALTLRKNSKTSAPTAVIAHGANPGIVSHFVKDALLKIAKDTKKKIVIPQTREEWAKLAKTLGVKVIHIAERDTQVSKNPKKLGEFLNTWSVDGFYSEGCQPAEMGWGTHEKKLPKKGREHRFGDKSAIYLEQPGLATQVRSWTPISGPQYSWVITHNESISIADYFTLKDSKGRVIYRPTVHYAYHPCDNAVLSLLETAESGNVLQKNTKVLGDEILSGGVDELGVLLMGHKKNALWYGSRLSIDEARRLVPHNNATGLQVTAGILGAMAWILENPALGVVEADEMDHKKVLNIARPYLGKILAEYTNWTPLHKRGELFPEKLDTKDPWQFDNFLV